MENDTLRELSIAKALSMCFNDADYKKKDHLSGMLRAASTSFKILQTKKIAENLNYKLARFLPGNPAPAFEARDLKGNTVSLENFKGKYIYLAFFKTGCKVCEEEFRLIPDYQKKYGNKIAFVYVSVDKDINSLKDFLATYPKTNWPVLNNSSDELKENYQLLALPTYYLISRQGTFIQAPALDPGIDMEKVLSELSKKK